ncbi:MAG: helix-turn-helix domain-containing protein [Candidatus Berkelbacteria bacterium]
MDIRTLQQFGLSAKEAAVYLALLELGSASVSEVAQKAKINRTTAYDILEYLITYGLVSRVGDKKTKHYAAENPELLISYLEKKSKEFTEKAESAKNILPELKGMYNLTPRQPKVKYFEGDEGIIAMYEDSLRAKTGILSWLDIKVTLDFSADYFPGYYKRRTAKGVHIKAIVNDDPIARDYIERDDQELREIRVVPKEMMMNTPECYIYDDKVSFMSVRERFGVMIESKDIADAQRKLYELAWEKAGEYSSKILK